MGCCHNQPTIGQGELPPRVTRDAFQTNPQTNSSLASSTAPLHTAATNSIRSEQTNSLHSSQRAPPVPRSPQQPPCKGVAADDVPQSDDSNMVKLTKAADILLQDNCS